VSDRSAHGQNPWRSGEPVTRPRPIVCGTRPEVSEFIRDSGDVAAL
jgi:hypothetical protein